MRCWQVLRTRRPKMLMIGTIDAVVFAIILWQAVHFNDPLDSDPPPSVLYWGERIRSMALKAGDMAPDFQVSTADGETEFSLADLKTDRPTVLIFGSYTCPYFRAHMLALNALYQDFREDAHFYFIYTREAHPEEDGGIPENAQFAPIAQPVCIQDRVDAANTCTNALEIKMPVLIDELDNTTADRYQAWPERVYVIAPSRRILDAGGRSGAVDVVQLRRTLERLAAD